MNLYTTAINGFIPTDKIVSDGMKLRRLVVRNQSSTIRIPSRLNSIIDYDTNLITRRQSGRRSQFWCNFYLFLIKVDRSSSIFNKKINLSWLKDQKYQLKDWKCQFISKSQFIFTFSIIFDMIQSLFDYSWSISNLWSFLSRWNLFCCEDLDFDKEFGLKKSIKRQFDHDIS